LIPLAAVIGAATAAGVVADRSPRLPAERIAHRLMDALLWVVLPVVAFFNMAALELTVRVGAGIAFAYVALLATLAAAWLVGSKMLKLSRPSTGALMVAAALANTGYLGLPFNAAALGLDALPQAVAYDTLVSGIALVTIGFSVGAAFGTVAERPAARVRAFLVRNPALWATVAGLLAPPELAPAWAVDASRALVFAAVPLGFFAVGVALAREAVPGGRIRRLLAPLEPAVAGASALKLLVPPAIVLALSTLVIDVPPAYLLQSAMPTGVNTLVVCHAYGLARRIAAGAIAWTTAIVVCAGVISALV
jgi:malate permease and related proteins